MIGCRFQGESSPAGDELAQAPGRYRLLFRRAQVTARGSSRHPPQMRAGVLAEVAPRIRALLSEVLLVLDSIFPACPTRWRSDAVGQVAGLAAGEMVHHGQGKPGVCADLCRFSVVSRAASWSKNQSTASMSNPGPSDTDRKVAFTIQRSGWPPGVELDRDAMQQIINLGCVVTAVTDEEPGIPDLVSVHRADPVVRIELARDTIFTIVGTIWSASQAEVFGEPAS
jgi:hypothetical protein